jgi:hypothetical protein
LNNQVSTVSEERIRITILITDDKAPNSGIEPVRRLPGVAKSLESRLAD